MRKTLYNVQFLVSFNKLFVKLILNVQFYSNYNFCTIFMHIHKCKKAQYFHNCVRFLQIYIISTNVQNFYKCTKYLKKYRIVKFYKISGRQLHCANLKFKGWLKYENCKKNFKSYLHWSYEEVDTLNFEFLTWNNVCTL